MKALLKVSAFILMVCAQLAVPASMIYGRETTLAQGEQFKFRCAPVDPYDAFRGRYVALSIQGNAATDSTGHIRPGQKAYALLERDEDGFAVVTDVLTAPPERGPYVQVTTGHAMQGGRRLNFPFDRYYMNEELAPLAEQAVRGFRSDTVEAWISVRVRKGNAAIENLYLNGLPVEEYLRRRAGQGTPQAASPL